MICSPLRGVKLAQEAEQEWDREAGPAFWGAGLEEVTNKVTVLEGQVNQLTWSVGDLDKENATMVSVGTQKS